MKTFLSTVLTVNLCTVLFLVLLGCGSDEEPVAARTFEKKVAALQIETAQLREASYRPRLGNIMGMVQMRHGKLWFAGESENWELAGYELHELKEDFEDVEKFHPTHGGAALPLGRMAAQLTGPPLAQLANAVQARDKSEFRMAFDAVTASCNTCHQAAGIGFNVMKRPVIAPFSNQEFGPRKAAVAALQTDGFAPK